MIFFSEYNSTQWKVKHTGTYRSISPLQVDCEYENIGEVASIQMLSERSSGSHHSKQDPSTSASTGTEHSNPVHIYENICTNTAGAIYSNIKKNDYNASRTHTELLPLKTPERRGDTCRKHSNKPRAMGKAATKPTESRANSVSPGHSRSCSHPTKSLWFGLDSSGTAWVYLNDNT